MPVLNVPGFESIPEGHPLHGLTAPLIAAHNHVEERMHGTAFVIAPELAFTAKHVVVDYLDKIQNENVEQRMTDGGHHTAKMTFFMFLLVPVKNGRRVALTVRNTYFPGSGDIALLRLTKPSDLEWSDLAPYPVLRLLPPDAGTRIEALGYPDSNAVRRPDGVVELHTWPRISSGTVQEVHGLRRDPSLLKYPCFQVNARLEGGMSGGPVVDPEGRICGVISRSYDLLEGEEPIGYAASLWPTGVISMWDLPGLANDKLRFYDLLRRGRVQSCDLSRVTGGFDEHGKFVVHATP